MNKIKIEYNVGAIDTTTVEVGFVPISVKDINDESLITNAVKKAINSLESFKSQNVIGVADIFFQNKKLFEYRFFKFGDKFMCSNTNIEDGPA